MSPGPSPGKTMSQGGVAGVLVHVEVCSQPIVETLMLTRVRRRFSEHTLADWLLLLGVALSALAYLFLNRPTGRVHSMESSLDRRVPLEPPFAVPYLVFLPIFWAFVLWAFVGLRWWRPLATAIIVTYLVSDATYLLYQTYVERPDVQGNSVFDALVKFIYRSDAPYNDFPSTHSSSAAILASYFCLMRSRVWPLAVAFALLVVASTLLVKQHVVADAVGGVALGTVATLGAVLVMRVRHR
jgi:membrane-associated phospholipid phosphatase